MKKNIIYKFGFYVLAYCKLIIYWKNFKSEAIAIKKQLPIKYNKNITLTNFEFKKNDAIYEYKLININLDTADVLKIEKMKSNVKGMASMMVCTNTMLKKIVTRGVNIIYVYNDINDKLITKAKVTNNDCQKVDEIKKQLNK